jgi:sporulation protein YlmC with PRC-barrel domain
MDKISDLKGKTVLTADGKTVGTLADLSIDERTWRIGALVIEVDAGVASLFGVKKRLLKAPRVKIGVDKVEHLADIIKLRDELAHLKVEMA